MPCKCSSVSSTRALLADNQCGDLDIAQITSAGVGSVQGLALSTAQLQLSSLDPAMSCDSTDTDRLFHELGLLSDEAT